NPTGPQTGSGKVIRGGSWGQYSILCRSASRHWNYPWYRDDSYGFRVCQRAN
ncbi:MAG: SUMF1/EgtB/PvdO family nonheme iron enzyme, partial [Candidatus Coatesbacteria bacterium]|nr:SUMF1/EgtB/PvdO family nonheme iron enzyme [Candidatus Coatesbacteria bacterium]